MMGIIFEALKVAQYIMAFVFVVLSLNLYQDGDTLKAIYFICFSIFMHPMAKS